MAHRKCCSFHPHFICISTLPKYPPFYPGHKPAPLSSFHRTILKYLPFSLLSQLNWKHSSSVIITFSKTWVQKLVQASPPLETSLTHIHPAKVTQLTSQGQHLTWFKTATPSNIHLISPDSTLPELFLSSAIKCDWHDTCVLSAEKQYNSECEQTSKSEGVVKRSQHKGEPYSLFLFQDEGCGVWALFSSHLPGERGWGRGKLLRFQRWCQPLEPLCENHLSSTSPTYVFQTPLTYTEDCLCQPRSWFFGDAKIQKMHSRFSMTEATGMQNATCWRITVWCFVSTWFRDSMQGRRSWACCCQVIE